MDVLDAIRKRRSVNFFDPDRLIAKETLSELLSVSNLAPSSFNLQPWRVIVVQDPAKKRELRSHALDQSKIEEASVVLIVIADPDVHVNLEAMLDSWEQLGYIRTEKRSEISRMVTRRYGSEGSEERKLFAVKNASLFAMSIMIAAKGLGLEAHAMDGFDEGPMKRAFGIPDGKLVPMLIALGYIGKGAEILPRAFRRPLSEFVTVDSYDGKSFQ